MKRILSLFLAAVLLLCSFAMIPSVQATENRKLIAITFDDGPCAYTERLLDGLQARGVKATFFMVGNRIEANADIVTRVYAEGHQVANHTWSHPELTTQTDDGVISQVSQTQEALDAICGAGTTYLFRTPYGSTNAHTRSLVGMPLIQWDLDTRDWESRDATAVKDMILNYTKDGAIILLHDIHPTSVDGALAAIDELLTQGYEFVTVRELFRRRGVALTEGELYYNCPPNGTDLGPITAPVITSTVTDGKLYITIAAQEGAEIYYTTDGSCPNQESHKYAGTFPVESPCTITAAAAYNMNGSRSDLVSQTFTTPTADAPKIRIDDGVLSLSTTTVPATVYYSLDGNSATIHSQAYSEPVTLRAGAIISATAAGDEYLASPVVNGYYTKRGNFFHDVFPGRWYTDAIDLAVSSGHMSSDSDSYFAPCAPVTRGELVTMLYRYAQIQREDVPAVPFTDVTETDECYAAVSWAYGAGIISGYPGDLFLPEQPVTRQEMSKIISTYLSRRSKILPERTGQSEQFTDAALISPWAAPYVEDMVAIGLFQGDDQGRYLPLCSVTRAQAAVILIRLAEVEPSLPGAEL